uniref:Uncharacterized protein n=1 Tax=Anguilla anguilla TaxID=7936 RepID=A0A0E9RQS0_ANGAN
MILTERNRYHPEINTNIYHLSSQIYRIIIILAKTPRHRAKKVHYHNNWSLVSTQGRHHLVEYIDDVTGRLATD